jgi:hypothetical protein
MTVPSDAAQPPRDEYVEDGATLVHAINFTFAMQTRSAFADPRRRDRDPARQPDALHRRRRPRRHRLDHQNERRRRRRDDQDRPQHARDQLADYEPGDDFPAESHEEALDKLTRIVQELARDLLSREDVRDMIARCSSPARDRLDHVDDAGDTITIASTVRRRVHPRHDRRHARRRRRDRPRRRRAQHGLRDLEATPSPISPIASKLSGDRKPATAAAAARRPAHRRASAWT